ncbi:MAG: hypothetical protein IJJ99_07265 [Oscillospiraceae bacterium]|nr:hypothetical protein [Oscillospiraceae bacterium]
MKRFLCLLLCLSLLAALLSLQVTAEDTDLLQSRGDQFIKNKGLTEEDFAVYFYNTKTREEYVYNENAFFPVGHDWILPLHMYFYEHETYGEYDPPLENPDEIFTIEGMTLEKCRYNSIILDSTEVSRQMRDYLGSPEQYLALINQDYGHVEQELLPDSYFRDNCYSAAFLMNCLKRVTDHPELYRDMMQNFSLSTYFQTNDGFAGYDRAYNIVHLRGEENGFICDIGEIAGPDTYLLVCFASEDAGGDDLLKDVNELFFKYVEERNGEQQNTLESEDTGPQSQKDLTPSQPHDIRDSLVWIGIALAAAAVVAGIIATVIVMIRRREDRRYEERKLEEERRDSKKYGGSKRE